MTVNRIAQLHPFHPIFGEGYWTFAKQKDYLEWKNEVLARTPFNIVYVNIFFFIVSITIKTDDLAISQKMRHCK